MPPLAVPLRSAAEDDVSSNFTTPIINKRRAFNECVAGPFSLEAVDEAAAER